jgi:uncharacterized protein (TIGR03000 family)
MPTYRSTGYYPMPAYTVAPIMASAYIRVRVPAGAQVFFDDNPTAQMGTDRLFVTPPLDRGERYSYVVSARWMEGGKERRESRTVPVAPGQTAAVDFAR